VLRCEPNTVFNFFERRRKVTTTPHSPSDDPVRDERFGLGIEGSGIGMWDLDISTHRLLWSKITRKFFGVPDDLPLTYELFLSLLEPQDRERTDEAVRRSAETGCSFDMQYRVDNRSQLHRWVRARGSIVRDEQGVPRHLSRLRELIASNTLVGNDTVEVSVSDTGHGFHDDVNLNRFQPFFTTKETGMGVGLSIAARLSKHMAAGCGPNPMLRAAQLFALRYPPHRLRV
jgi:hypothetical protein